MRPLLCAHFLVQVLRISLPPSFPPPLGRSRPTWSPIFIMKPRLPRHLIPACSTVLHLWGRRLPTIQARHDSLRRAALQAFSTTTLRRASHTARRACRHELSCISLALRLLSLSPLQNLLLTFRKFLHINFFGKAAFWHSCNFRRQRARVLSKFCVDVGKGQEIL